MFLTIFESKANPSVFIDDCQYARQLMKELGSNVIPEENCCNSQGIACDSQNHIVRITKPGNGLTGKFNNSSPLLQSPYLNRLDLSNNKITGPLFTTFNQLTSLSILHLQQNNLTGTIDNLDSTTLTDIRLYTNKLEGSLPTLPNSLTTLLIYDNKMNGSLPSMPSGLENLLLGKINFKSNKFTGSITLNKPYTLSLNGNLVNSLFINDTVDLFSCDVADTLLTRDNVNYEKCRTSLPTAVFTFAKTSIWTTEATVADLTFKDTLYNANSSFDPSYTTDVFVLDKDQSMYSDSTIYDSSTSTSTSASIRLGNSSLPSTFVHGNTISTKNVINSLSTSLPSSTIHTPSTNTVPSIKSSSISTIVPNTTILIENTTILSPMATETLNDQSNTGSDSYTAFILIGAFGLLCIIVVIAGIVFKPKMIKSKFTRKNSYGSLISQTASMQTTVKSKRQF